MILYVGLVFLPFLYDQLKLVILLLCFTLSTIPIYNVLICVYRSWTKKKMLENEWGIKLLHTKINSSVACQRKILLIISDLIYDTTTIIIVRALYHFATCMHRHIVSHDVIIHEITDILDKTCKRLENTSSCHCLRQNIIINRNS